MENEVAIQRAYKSGKEAGRTEIVFEMLNDLKDEEVTAIDVLNEMRNPSMTGRTYKFISRYLPKRYKQNK